MNISLDLLRSFLAVYRQGSITAAAESLGLAQPTLTAQVRSLEAALGRRLFDRLPRGVASTPAADELARRVAGAIDDLESAVVDETTARYPSTVRIGGPADFLCEQALPALSGMVADGLQLRTTFGMPDGLLDAVVGADLDLAVISVRPRRRGVLAEPFYDEEFDLVAAPSWADRIKPERTDPERAEPERAVPERADPQRLAPIPLVAYGEEAPIVRRYWRTVFGTRLTRTPDLVVPDLRGALAAVTAGAGMTVLPRYLTARPLETGKLQLLAEPELPPLNTLFLVHRPQSEARRSVAAVRARLLELGRGPVHSSPAA
ncbi:LysR family transcriptional regulator [Phytoactinopolyspora halotolerans]|uniref:LysR family transcriptional regulator n=1 Tax=Phytoactinopolyspora halotolerans TaxID=1981512 RepID=UPI001C203D1B|nr:LysR family transcriptional regulator [Phytoactinopolyspora halotolerans]